MQLVCTLSAAAAHDMQHPETAARVAALAQSDPLQHPRVSVLQPPPAAEISSQLEAVLQLVHPAGYLARLQEICSSLQSPTMIDDSTYIAPGSYTACCETAAAVLDVMDAVLDPATSVQQQQQHPTMGFCMVRPPGHHVKASRPMGFGLINFIAVAARYALQQPHINKVLIIDWDVHPGNGVEDIFYECLDVLYISTHQQGLWPYTGKVTSTGTGKGKGYTINVPLPGDSGHDSMLSVWERVIEPAAHRHKPDIIMCSAGYDAHVQDPLAGLQFEARTYHMLCQRTAALAKELCQGRCVWILEGGYHLASLADSVASSLCAILDEPWQQEQPQLLREEPLAKVEALLDQVTRTHGLV